MIEFIAGLLIGGFFGVILMCIFSVSGREDRREDAELVSDKDNIEG